ncbi:hypothetical protein AUC70_00710 [Methyloceanibacter stevinii]|uniref:HTH gntR-type domain-containing protein n=1 Tax=Methyloceanibacter stevinii TaxID=1774970 RepID=A0A1E3VPP5_9HYPH|nr:hypothetical protein AUC70_00710 [Methyloceanibacter stevinii]
MNPQSNDDTELPVPQAPKRPSGVKIVSAYLQRAIETGAYSQGERLPAERQLAQTFNTARSTVRRALDKLEKAGLVSRRLGSGTFVGAAPQSSGSLLDFIGGLTPLDLIAPVPPSNPLPHGLPQSTPMPGRSRTWRVFWKARAPLATKTTSRNGMESSISFWPRLRPIRF